MNYRNNISRLIQTIVSIMRKFIIVDVSTSLTPRIFYGDVKRVIRTKIEKRWQVFLTMKNFFIKLEAKLESMDF